MSDGYPILSADESGVWRQDRPEQEKSGIRWEEIFALGGYKLDCIKQVDTILELDWEYGEFLELNSNWTGFDSVVAQITARMPYLESDWFARVQALSKDDKPVTIWRRS